MFPVERRSPPYAPAVSFAVARVKGLRPERLEYRSLILILSRLAGHSAQQEDRMNKQNFLTLRCTALLAILALMLSVVAALAQNAVPPTARQAAASPAFASRLHPPAGGAHLRRPQPRTDAALPQYGVIYDNGPYNGTTDAWTINFGFAVSDSFTSGTITGLHFVYWDASITDLLTSVDMAVSTTSFGGTFQTSTGVINTFLGVNQYGYNLYQADVTFSGMTGAGYITLQNACSTSGCSTVNPIYWDENSGPSTAYESSIGSIPSEAFTLTGGGGCSTDLPASGQSLKAQLQSTPTILTQGPALRILHDFSGAEDGSASAGLAIDQAGNLYGPSYSGGQHGAGNVYKLVPRGSDWEFSLLYSFLGGDDGRGPSAALTLGRYGILYGTTAVGGGEGCSGYGCGTVFSLRPSPRATTNVLGGWKDTVIHSFTSDTYGVGPGSVIFDSAGNLYGVTYSGGAYGKGTVFQLVPVPGGWQYRVLHDFTGGADGAKPIGSVMFDRAGNLYGAAYTGGSYGCGTVFQLAPSGGGWTENTVYTFRGQEDSGNPLDLVIDQTGNLYGATIGGGCLAGNCGYGIGIGGVFMLTPGPSGWSYSRIYNYNGYFNDTSLGIDTSGNLYGTLARGGDPCYCGEIFKLSPGSGGTWNYSDLHDFNGTDGWWPFGKVIIDANGNVYGVTQAGGAYNAGVVWEISP